MPKLVWSLAVGSATSARCGLRCGTPHVLSAISMALPRCADRLLEGGAAQRLVAGLAPPFDRGVGHAGLREVIRERFRLGGRGVGEAIAQNLGDAAVQDLAPALEQIFVGRVLNERVLEAIIALRRQALDQHDVGFGELLQRRLQRLRPPCRPRRVAGHRRSRGRSPSRSAPPRAPDRAGRAAPSAIVAASAGSPGCRRRARRAPTEAASLPRRTAARRRCARRRPPPHRAAARGGRTSSATMSRTWARSSGASEMVP